VVCFVLFAFVLCVTKHTTIAVGHYHTQEEDKQSKTHNTVAVGHHHTQEDEKQNKTHTTIAVGHHHTQDEGKQNMCMVVSNSYCGVFCFVCLRLVYGGVQQLLWCVLCFSSWQAKQNTPQ
jgi:co-chaperonin GroES (HSP10)